MRLLFKNGDKNGYYKIQSDGAVNSNRTGIINTPSQAEYDFDKDYGFIPSSKCCSCKVKDQIQFHLLVRILKIQ